jgi:hypothetical protein
MVKGGAMSEWLIDEADLLAVGDARSEIEKGIVKRASRRNFSGDAGMESGVEAVALRLRDLVVHDNRKWWGEAEIRLDAIVVHGNSADSTIYEANTVRFERVADGDRLINEPLLLFYGNPRYFIDFSLCVSRDRKDAEDLSSLLGSELQSSDTKSALESVMNLGSSIPEAVSLAAAVAGAAQIGALAYKVLRATTGTTVGVYRASWLEHSDNFGIGKHPPEGSYSRKDLSFQ